MMRTEKRVVVGAGLSLIFVFAVATAPAQFGADPVPPSWHQGPPGTAPTPTAQGGPHAESAEERMERGQLELQNAKRQREAVEAANSLLTLATELKKEVDSTGAATVSGSATKKANEIIKLAKQVKDKIRPL